MLERGTGRRVPPLTQKPFAFETFWESENSSSVSTAATRSLPWLAYSGLHGLVVCFCFVLVIFLPYFFFSVYLDFWFWFCYFSSWEREERKNIKLGGQGGNGESREGKVWLKYIVWKNLLKIKKKNLSHPLFPPDLQDSRFPSGYICNTWCSMLPRVKGFILCCSLLRLKAGRGPPHLSPQTRSKGRRWLECPRGNDWVRFYIPPAPEL